MRLPVYEVIVGESLPDLGVWVTVDRILLTDLATDATFSLVVRNADDTANLFVKTTGILGMVGSGTQESGTPNLVVTWALNSELDQLAAGRSHRAMLTITRTSDSRQRFYEFIIRAIGRVGA